MTSLETLPGFLAHVVTGMLLLCAGTAIYVRATPHDELALIRGGSVAAAISLAGTMLGLALAIGAAIAHSANLLDALVWGAIAVVVQLLVFIGCSRLLLPGWRVELQTGGGVAGAILIGAVAVAAGLINAASLTP